MYATKDELIARFGNEISQLERMHPTPETSISDALQDASEEIDSYIAKEYSLPLPNIPNNLRRLACDIARYRLYFQQPTETVKNRYEEAVDFLKGVRDGKNKLAIINEDKEVIDDNPPQSPATMPVGTTYKGGVFGDAVLDMMPSIK